MAYSQSSVVKTTFGNKKVLFIKGTVASADTSATVETGLVAIDFVQVGFGDLVDKTITHSESEGTITLGFTDPAATKIVSLMIVGH